MEYSVFIQYDNNDKIYIASIPELKGCMAPIRISIRRSIAGTGNCL